MDVPFVELDPRIPVGIARLCDLEGEARLCLSRGRLWFRIALRQPFRPEPLKATGPTQDVSARDAEFRLERSVDRRGRLGVIVEAQNLDVLQAFAVDMARDKRTLAA